jgi:hypothetical protein
VPFFAVLVVGLILYLATYAARQLLIHAELAARPA